MQKWEYLFVDYIARGQYAVNGLEASELDGKDTYQLLNHFGEQGWELIHIKRDIKMKIEEQWLFKRPKS